MTDVRRLIDVLLPPGYYAAAPTRYPVLYLNDGQDLKRLRLKATLEALIGAGEIPPILAVAVHATRDRLREYGTAGMPNARGLGDRADEYARFLTREVMPHVHRSYRVLRGPAHTAIAGSSLGGLSAFDIAWKHPHLFGNVGVFSGSFWWRTAEGGPRQKQDSRIAHRMVRRSPKRPGLRLWFQAGTLDESEDRDQNGVIDAIQDTTELMDELRRKGYREGEDMMYVQVEGGGHDQETWGAAMPEFLRWAFGGEMGR